MSSALDAIIARGFNVGQPDFTTRFLAARDDRSVEVNESNLASAALARQINQFNLDNSQRQLGQQKLVSSGLSDLMQIPQQRAAIDAGQEAAAANFIESASRFQPAAIPALSGEAGTPTVAPGELIPGGQFPQVGVNPALVEQAMEMLAAPGIKLDERQQQVIQQIAANSPEVQSLLLQQQFATPAPATNIGKLIAAKEALPPGHPDIPIYDAAITKATTISGGDTFNIGDTPEPDQLSKAQTGAFVAEGVDFRKAGAVAEDMLGLIQEFRNLNSRVETGALAEWELDANKWLIGLGLNPFTDQDIASAEALQARTLDFVMLQVQKTKGAVSNKEMALFERGAAGLGKTSAGNALVLNFAERVALRQRKVNRLRNQFVMGLKGEDRNNALPLWNLHLDQWHIDNPFFSPEEQQALFAAGGGQTDFGPVTELGVEEGRTGDKEGFGPVIAKKNANGELRWVANLPQ